MTFINCWKVLKKLFDLHQLLEGSKKLFVLHQLLKGFKKNYFRSSQIKPTNPPGSTLLQTPKIKINDFLTKFAWIIRHRPIPPRLHCINTLRVVGYASSNTHSTNLNDASLTARAQFRVQPKKNLFCAMKRFSHHRNSLFRFFLQLHAIILRKFFNDSCGIQVKTPEKKSVELMRATG